MTLNWLEMRRQTSSRVRVDEEARILRLARENACLTQDNARLRSEYDDLAASTNTWIRLYEAALERANMSAAECSGLQQPAGRR
jgi:hypothetical protein